MALAILAQDEDDSDGKRWFQIDIGKNRYFRLAAGGAETVAQAGVRLISNPTWISSLQGPLEPEMLGRTRFGIPTPVFSREVQYVQMMSYRTNDRRGPAVSPIIHSHNAITLPVAPALSFSSGQAHTGATSKSLSYRPARSQAMFLGGLLNGLVGMLPQIGDLMRNLLPAAPAAGGSAGGAAGGNNGGQLLTRLTAPETVALLQQLFRQISATPAAAAPTPAPAGSQQSSLSRAAFRKRMSEAQAVPLLALAPLLGQVLNPQTVQAVLEAPNRHTQTIINGLTDVIKLALVADQQQMEHLRKLNPGVDDPSLDRLLESMSKSLSGKEPGIKFQLFERVRIRFAGLRSVPVLGETRVIYLHGKPLQFWADIEVPSLKSGVAPVLSPAILELKIKDATTLDCKFVKRFKLDQVQGSGPLPLPATVTAEECAGLEMGHDYLVTMSFAWRARSGRVMGNMVTQRITLIGAALYAGLEDYGETVELSDPGRHRDYWHRVWAGRFEAGSRRLEGELTYTSTLAPRGNDRNARLDAKVETRPKDRSAMTQLARVRAGMEFSLAALQRLTEELSPGVENAPELLDAALTAETFRDRMSMAVRLAFAVRGRDGESFGLWSYPSFKRARLAMMQPAEILETGNVSSFREISGELVVPVTLHVLATATRERDQRDGEDADDAGAEQIDGQSVIGRYKAGFYPVRLVAESPAS